MTVARPKQMVLILVTHIEKHMILKKVTLHEVDRSR